MVAEFLILELGFRKVSSLSRDLDFNKFSCVIRIHVIHYLYWSEDLKHFTIGVLHDRPKGKAGGGFEQWTYVMIPKVIRTTEQAFDLVKSICDFEMMKAIAQ